MHSIIWHRFKFVDSVLTCYPSPKARHQTSLVPPALGFLQWEPHHQICPHNRTCEHQPQSHRCHFSLTSALGITELGRHCDSDCSWKRTGPLVQRDLLDLQSWMKKVDVLTAVLCPFLRASAFCIAAGHISILLCFLCGWIMVLRESLHLNSYH